MTGDTLRQIRKRLGLTQVAFAKQLGIHPNSLARMERGELGMREPVARLARLLETLEKKARRKRGGR